jgi:aryl-alcohol dehydrogenase-like predicted oxidoreductase
MRYKLLGKSGLRVSELCLGTMTFGDDWGWGAPKDTSRQIFDAFVEAGGNFIDTANLYTNGSSEKIVGDWYLWARGSWINWKITSSAWRYRYRPNSYNDSIE